MLGKLMTRQLVLDLTFAFRHQPHQDDFLNQVIGQDVIERNVEQRGLVHAREDPFVMCGEKYQSGVHLPAGAQPAEVGHVVGDDDQALLQRIPRNRLVGSRAKAHVVDMARDKSPAPRDLHEVGREVLVNQQPELMGLDASLGRA